MEASSTHRLSIAETRSSYETSDGRKAWEVDIFLDGNHIIRNRELYDPFSKSDHIELSAYLNTLLAKEEEPRAEVESVSRKVDGYRSSLFSQLDIRDRLDHKQIEIDVEESYGPGSTPETETVHCLQWEHFESPNQWPLADSYVTVRRIVSPSVRPTEQQCKRVSSWSMVGNPKPSINVLVVIARDISDEKRNTDPSASTALLAVTKVREILKSLKGSHQINIEVARPGSYKALQEHLERTERDKGYGFFHIIHLDMHGYVTKGEAKLQFAEDDVYGQNLVGHSAREVGQLLAKHGIPSAVVSACESARANTGISANLGRIFSQEGVTNVLAMSYNFSSSAAILFHTKFYEALLIDTCKFSEAAHHGRSKLRETPTRQSPHEWSCEVQDWFVPVVYTNHQDLRITVSGPSVDSRASDGVNGNHVKWMRFTNKFYALAGAVRDGLSWTKVSLSRLTWSCFQRLSPHSLRLRDGFADGEEDMELFLQLDLYILRLERDLLEYHSIVIWGPPKAGKSSMLRQLSRMWLSTNFVEQVYFIQARRFSQGPVSTLLQTAVEYLRGDSRNLIMDRKSPLHTSIDSLAVPRTVVIIDHVDELVPNCTELSNFLDKLATAKKFEDRHPSRPYLILIGRMGINTWSKYIRLAQDPAYIHHQSRPAMRHL